MFDDWVSSNTMLAAETCDMPEALKYLQGMPAWIAMPIVVVTLLLTLWPQIRQMIADLKAVDRSLENEKRRLELLKLRYEIEAIKKANGLKSLPSEGAAIAVMPAPLSQSESAPTSTGCGISIFGRFAAGAAGAVAPSVYRYLILFLSEPNQALPTIGYFLGVVILCAVGGLGAVMVPRHRASWGFCALVGLSIVLLIQMGVLTAVQQRLPEVS
jgi:hypothetical protein